MQPQALKKLSGLLANTYTVAVMTQNVHWHIQGSCFYAIHTMTDKQYRELLEAVDMIAEHIRSHGGMAPACMEEFIAQRTVSEPATGLQNSDDFVQHLIDGHLELREHLLGIYAVCSDPATTDMLDERLRAHDVMIWMLRSSLSHL